MGKIDLKEGATGAKLPDSQHPVNELDSEKLTKVVVNPIAEMTPKCDDLRSWN